MTSDLYRELADRNYLKVKADGAKYTKKTQRNGSALDRYRTEILFYRHEMKCSYGDITKWLLVYKGIKRSRSSVLSKIKMWEKENATDKKSSA